MEVQLKECDLKIHTFLWNEQDSSQVTENVIRFYIKLKFKM